MCVHVLPDLVPPPATRAKQPPPPIDFRRGIERPSTVQINGWFVTAIIARVYHLAKGCEVFCCIKYCCRPWQEEISRRLYPLCSVSLVTHSPQSTRLLLRNHVGESLNETHRLLTRYPPFVFPSQECVDGC